MTDHGSIACNHKLSTKGERECRMARSICARGDVIWQFMMREGNIMITIRVTTKVDRVR